MTTALSAISATALVAIVGLLLHVEHRLTRVEVKWATADTRAGRQDQTIRSILVGLARQATARNREDWIALLAGFAPSFNAVISKEEEQRNPLTPAELHRLKLYRDKLTRLGELLTPGEAEDFSAIVNKLDHDQPGNLDIGPLIHLAGILRALAEGAISAGGWRMGDAPDRAESGRDVGI